MAVLNAVLLWVGAAVLSVLLLAVVAMFALVLFLMALDRGWFDDW